nr:efflux RND transporter periplasmic adaptor subunit [Planctomycetota bacterium]
MKNKKYILLASIAIVLVVVVWPPASGTIGTIRAQAAEPGHEGHDHAKPAEKEPEHKEHAGHDENESADEHEEHAGHDDHEGLDEPGAVIPVTAAQIRKFGIVLARASAGKLDKKIRLPGEITIDADHSAHIVPRASGVVRKVLAKVGDKVRAGDILAVLDSAELGAAKILYLTKVNELSCCAMELARAEAIDANTVKLLQMLDKSPGLDSLTEIKFTDMGSGHSTLISAYAELVFTKAEYQREKKLFEEKIASKGDYLTAASAYKKAYAAYIAACSSIAYESRRGFLEAKQSRLSLELALRAEDSKLHLLGVTPHDIELLRAAAGTSPGAKKAECNDPNCKDCKPSKGGKGAPDKGGHGKDDHGDHCKDVLDECLGQYALRAPFDGVVIQKHIALGEKISDAEAFTIADMSRVWVDLSVYQKDLPFVKKGQKVHISVGYGIPAAEGEISLVSSVVDETTRTCLARVVLDNEKGRYRPGLFVT